MKDSVVVGLRCLLFCRKLVKRENIVTENLIKNHNMFSKNEFRQFIYEFRHFRKFCNKYDIIQILNNPVPVSLLSGDRKPQIRFLGNHHSGSGNLYHKSFRM